MLNSCSEFIKLLALTLMKVKLVHVIQVQHLKLMQLIMSKMSTNVIPVASMVIHSSIGSASTLIKPTLPMNVLLLRLLHRLYLMNVVSTVSRPTLVLPLS